MGESGPSLELAIATMRSRRPAALAQFEARELIETPRLLIVDQTPEPESRIVLPPTVTGSVLTFDERGVSRSRNRAIDHAVGEVVVISDEDVTFTKDAFARIREAYRTHPDADVITFTVLAPDGSPFKRYDRTTRRHDLLSVMRVSSIEVTFRAASVRRAGLRFDESFGLGTDCPTGEENVFLKDALERGMKVYFHPHPIAIHERDHSGTDFTRSGFFAEKARLFVRLFGRRAMIYFPAFVLKKVSHWFGKPRSMSEIALGFASLFRAMGRK